MEQHTGGLNLWIVSEGKCLCKHPVLVAVNYQTRRNQKSCSMTFQFDPLRMISSGTLAATVPPDRVKDVKNALTAIGVLLSDVGQLSDGAGVRLLRKEETRYYRQIRCEEDELTRMWTLYPRNG